jgi:mono/diheme cytochrome c family protein
VLAVFVFIAFWVVLALGLFYIAARRSGVHPAVERQTRRANRLVSFVFVFLLIGFGIVIPAAVLIGNNHNASAQVGGITLTSNEKAGRELFGQHCGVCHTLAASNSVGKVGPNLDELRPQASLVLHTVQNGCLPNAPSGSAQQCLGDGVMPSGIVQGRQAQQVAAFVARVAGQE